MEALLKLGIVVAAGLIGGRIAKIFKLPNVTGYLIIGLLLGPSFLHIVTSSDLDAWNIVNEFALAAIAFSIGSEFVFKDMKKLGKAIIVITLLEVVGAVFVVFATTYYIFKQPFAFCIVIASMSAATAPAATLMVIRQFKASGPLTKTILPVVALDDVFGIIVFGLALSVAKITSGQGNYTFTQMITAPFIEILGSLALGAVFGFLLVVVSHKVKDKEELLGLILAIIGLTTGIALILNLSALLACIVVGTVLVNVKQHSSRFYSTLNDFTPPIYLLFFTLAGASLDLKILSSVGFLGLGYILARAGGKILGAWLGAKVMKSEPQVRRYLGLGLLPQGGISIGLSVIVKQQLPEYAVAITTIIMFSVLVYETTGPIFAKIALDRAGEIPHKP